MGLTDACYKVDFLRHEKLHQLETIIMLFQ